MHSGLVVPRINGAGACFPNIEKMLNRDATYLVLRGLIVIEQCSLLVVRPDSLKL